MNSKRFSSDAIRPDTTEDGTPCFFFAHDLLDEFADLFSHCENHEQVECDLKDAGVVQKGDKCKGGGRLYITFKTKQQGEKFVTRLNAYLTRMAAFLNKN